MAVMLQPSQDTPEVKRSDLAQLDMCTAAAKRQNWGAEYPGQAAFRWCQKLLAQMTMTMTVPTIPSTNDMSKWFPPGRRRDHPQQAHSLCRHEFLLPVSQRQTPLLLLLTIFDAALVHKLWQDITETCPGPLWNGDCCAKVVANLLQVNVNLSGNTADGDDFQA